MAGRRTVLRVNRGSPQKCLLPPISLMTHLVVNLALDVVFFFMASWLIIKMAEDQIS